MYIHNIYIMENLCIIFDYIRKNQDLLFTNKYSTLETLIFKIMHIVKENGSEFAYPSTSLYVESMPQD